MPSPTDGVTALRGTLVTCRDDPFIADPAKAFAVESDGVVICQPRAPNTACQFCHTAGVAHMPCIRTAVRAI